MLPKKIRTKEVVVVLPYDRNKVLMQLRDFKSHILFPGCWAFFGGSINDGERPEDAASRELYEEIGYKAKAMHKLGKDREFGYILIHSYCCQLTSAIEGLRLKEGLDLALFPLEEAISSREFYSVRLKRSFPVANTPYVTYILKKLNDYIGVSKETR